MKKLVSLFVLIANTTSFSGTDITKGTTTALERNKAERIAQAQQRCALAKKLETVLNETIEAAKKCHQLAQSTCNLKLYKRTMICAGSIAAILSAALCPYGLNVVNGKYCSASAIAGLLAAIWGYSHSSDIKISNMRQKLATVPVLLNSTTVYLLLNHKDVDLALTQLNVSDVAVQENLNKIKTLTEEELDQFAADAHNGKYDNLITKDQ